MLLGISISLKSVILLELGIKIWKQLGDCFLSQAGLAKSNPTIEFIEDIFSHIPNWQQERRNALLVTSTVPLHKLL